MIVPISLHSKRKKEIIIAYDGRSFSMIAIMVDSKYPECIYI